MPESVPHVVIVGGGFGGLTAAQALGRAPVRVTLLDRKNHHLFQPLLYQVATAGLSAPDIAEPIRRVLKRQRNTTVLMAEVARVDAPRKVVVLSDGVELSYDYLILACGATHHYFGHPEWARFAPGLKTAEDALEIRRRVLLAYEAAERTGDEAERREHLTFVVVGGGPTGVEMAGALAEIARHTLARDFRRFDPTEARVLLLEAMDRILGPYPPELSQRAEESLRELGVELRKGAKVTDIDADGVTLAGGERLRSRTVIWTAGVAGEPIGRTLGAPVDRAGRVLVEPDLSAPGHPEVFVVGDLAALTQDGKPVPGVAPAAIQEGRHAAKSVVRRVAGAPTQPFHYRDKGSLATIGRRRAVAEIGRLRISGLLAWLAWILIHVFFLIGFRNRVVVMFEWAWDYFTFARSARIILTGPGTIDAPRDLPPPALPSVTTTPPPS